MNHKVHLNHTLGWLLASLLILIFVYVMRLGLHPFISSSSYFYIWSLATVLFLLPDFLVYKFCKVEKWYNSSEYFTIVVLIGLSLLGLFGSKFTVIDYFIYPIVMSAILLVTWALYRIWGEVQYMSILLPAFMGFVFVLDIYQSEGLSPFFYEKIVMGTGFIDTLNHAAITNIFSNHLASSTGVDGILHYSYHWGSHAIFGGLKNLLGIDSISFYNVGYPSIFVVLLFKSMLGLVLRLNKYLLSNKLETNVVLVFMIFLFSTNLLTTRVFFWLESTTMANIMIMLYLGILLMYLRDKKDVGTHFLLFSFLVFLIISTIKISHGFVIISGMGYLILRTQRDIKLLATMFVLGLIISLFVFNYVLLIDKVVDTGRNLNGNMLILYISNRMIVFWSNSGMTWTYFAGILVAILALSRNGYFSSLSSLRSAIYNRSILGFELLIVLNIIGLIGAVYVSDHGLDVFFFMSIQLLLSSIYVIQLFAVKWTSMEIHPKISNFLIGVVMIMVLVSKPENVSHLANKGIYSRQMESLKTEREILNDLLIDLKVIQNKLDPDAVAIYIPQSEHWYYNSQTNMISAPFIVPSISGFVLIGGISEQIWYSDFSRYGYNVYRFGRDGIIYDTDEAIDRAREYGFSKLLVYSKDNNRLSREIISL